MKKLVSVFFVVIMVMTIVLPVKVVQAAPDPLYVFVSELPVGSQIVDNSREWAYRFGANYTGADHWEPVVWRLVAKNHTGYPANSVTLLSEYFIASSAFDNSTDRGSSDGSARWDWSGTPNATLGVRPFLQMFYMDGLSAEFRDKVFLTTISTETRYDTDGNWAVDNPVRTYTTDDRVFLPSYEDLFSSIGSTTLAYFDGAANALRSSGFPGGSNEFWWTRSENVITTTGTTASHVWKIPGSGESNHHGFANGSDGIRPMLNLANDVLVRAQANDDGHHEVVWDVVAQVTDSDLDGIYFAGDTLSFNIYNLPANDNVRVNFRVYSFVGAEIEYAPVLTGLDHEEVLGVDVWYTEGTTDERGMLSVSGHVSPDLPFGDFLIGISSGRLGVDALPVEIPTTYGYVIVGLPVVWGDFHFNFDLIDDLWDVTQEVWVTVGDIGRITFNPILYIDEEPEGLPPLIYVEAMLFVREWLSFTWDSDEKQFSIWVDSEALYWLAENGATIDIYDFAARFGVEGMTANNFRDYLDIKVYDNDGVLVADISGYLDISAITYDPVEDVLTIPVNHFSEYVFGLKSTPVTGTNINWYMLPGFLLLAVGLWVVKRYAVGSDA